MTLDNMGTITLDEFGRPVDSPINNHLDAPFQGGMDFDSQVDRNAVTLNKIKNFSFSAGTGGTLVLGGANNDNGLFLLRDANGTVIIKGDNTGHHYYGTNSTQELIKIDAAGFHAYDSGGTEQIQVNIAGFHGLNNAGGTLLTVDDTALTVYNSGGTKRIQVDGTGLHAYNSGGTQLIQVDGTGLHAYNTAGTEIIGVDGTGFKAYTSGGVKQIQVDVSGLHGYNSSGNEISKIDNTGVHIYDGSNNELVTLDVSGYAAYGDTSTRYRKTGSSSNYGITGIESGGDYIVSAVNSNKLKLGALGGNVEISATGDVRVTSPFYVGGSLKTAIMQTSQGYNTLYTNESPDVWFMDFCESKDKIDPMFLEVTSPPYHFIKCEDGEYQVWGKRKGFENIRFESKTKEQFDKNNDFWSTPNR